MAEHSAPCEHLAFLFAYEIRHGNHVATVRELAGQQQIYFAERLKIWGTPATAEIDTRVAYWDALDEHGLTADEWELMENPPQVEWGFRCTIHDHIIAGPSSNYA